MKGRYGLRMAALHIETQQLEAKAGDRRAETTRAREERVQRREQRREWHPMGMTQETGELPHSKRLFTLESSWSCGCRAP